MSRMIVVAGVHLDRAWPELGSAFGNALRRWSREVLARVVDQARQREADAILVVGDLMDRSTVLPETVEYAATVLGSFPGHVLIAPGSADWTGDDGPYELRTWPANVHIWTNADYAPAPTVPALWASAWTSLSSRPPRLPIAGLDDGCRTVVRAGLSGADMSGLAEGDRLVSSGLADREQLLVVADLVHEPGAPGGFALLIDSGNPDAGVELIDLPGQPGFLVEIDVTSLETHEEFESAIKSACSGDGPGQLRLSGVLAARILLPGFAGPEIAPDAVVDMNSLGYAVEVPDASDRSTQAEFLRAMALTRGDERERHQTTALGLRALSASATGD